MGMMVVCRKDRDEPHIIFQEFPSVLLNQVVRVLGGDHAIVLHSAGGGDTETGQGCQMHRRLLWR